MTEDINKNCENCSVNSSSEEIESKENENTIIERGEAKKTISDQVSLQIAPFTTNVLFSSPVLDALKTAAKNSELLSMKFQMPVTAVTNLSRISQALSKQVIESANKIANTCLPAITNVLQSPVLNWLRSIDFNPLFEIIKELQIKFDLANKYKELNEIYLQTMYETKWFPYAGWIADMSLFHEVNEIIYSSRGASKNREKRIDKVILSYYTKERIRKIKKSWWNSNLDFPLRKTLCQAIEAFLRGEYALTISCLSTMWEGLIYIKAKNVSPSDRKRQCMKQTKEDLRDLVEANDYELIFSDYYDNFIVSNCNAVTDVIEGVPNRHSVAHSWYRKYPNKKAALNAILLTDFIIQLNPL